MTIQMPFNSLLYPSGVNSSFHGGDGTFQDYIQHMQNVIITGRVDLDSNNRQKIIFANSPFELRPEQPTKKGILLIHGLYDSPYTVKDIADQFLQKNFLVRSILLPGHGTRPGDLLNLAYEEWIKATEFAVNSLKKAVDEVFILGYSVGGTLAINYALDNQEKIKALFLLAPALEPHRHLVNTSLYLRKILGFFIKSKKWYQIVKQTSFARYESFPCDSAGQATALMTLTRKKSHKKLLDIPIFMVGTADDESINIDTAIKFFLKQNNPHNRILLYGNNANGYNDGRITVHASAYPEQRILDLSHTSLTTAPENSHYGRTGDFKDFQHYAYDPKKYSKEIYFGAITPKNLRHYSIQRLSFNPDFTGLLQMIDKFLEKIS